MLSEDYQITASFQIQKVSPNGELLFQGPVFRNTILDSGLDLLAEYTVQELISTVNVGSGTATPYIEDTELEVFVDSTSGMSTDWQLSFDYEDPAHLEMFGIFTFGIGVVVGEISEVGLSRTPNAGYLNRQLIRDTIGAPTRVKVLENDELRIACWVYVYLSRQQDDPNVETSFLYNGEEIEAEVDLYTTGIGSGALSQFTGKTQNTKCQLSTETSTGFNRSGTMSVTSLEEYHPGTFVKKYAATSSPGSLDGDFNSLYIGWGDSDSWPAYTVYRLKSPITITDEEVFEIEFERSWGRYEG